MKVTKLCDTSTLTDEQIQAAWEEAYIKFETPAAERKKFIGRLKQFGQHEWERDAQIVEIFCGRGNGLQALEQLGFTNLEGVDISGELLAKYEGKAKLYVADCRSLPFEVESRDLIIVQGGLHHLPNLPEDLNQTFFEINRVLRPHGKFILVEPWLTPFLRLIHFLSKRNFIRRVFNKVDAFAIMVHYEAETYFNWLQKSSEILSLLKFWFIPDYSQIRFGKLMFIGRKKST